jgi:tetratricopeptide (TPR) repeat protein
MQYIAPRQTLHPRMIMTLRHFLTQLRLRRGIIAALLRIAARLGVLFILAPAVVLAFLGVPGREWFTGIAIAYVALTLAIHVLAWINRPAMMVWDDMVAGLQALRGGDYAEADDQFRAALAKAKAFRADDPVCGEILGYLAATARWQGNYDDAEQFGLRAVLAQELAWGPDAAPTIAAQRFLAGVYLDIARYAQAQAQLESALTSLGSGASVELVGCLNDLARSWAEQGQYSRAEPYLRRALEMVHRLRIDDTPAGVAVIHNLASACARQARFDEAEALIHAFLQQSDKSFGPDSQIVAGTLYQLALIRFLQQRCEEAEPIARRALAIREKIAGANMLALAAHLMLLGRILTRLGKLDEAEALLREALHAREEFLAPEHPLTAESFEAYAEVLKEQGRMIEAGEYVQRAGQIRDFHSPLRVISP